MRKLSASAQKLAARSQKESIFAFASDGKIEKAENSTAEMLKSTLSSYGCKDCASVFVAKAATTPFCVTCGSHHVTEKAKVESATLQLSDDKLNAVVCGVCNSGNILTKKTVTASEGHLHCTTCGASMNVPVEAKAATLEEVVLDPAVEETPLAVTSEDFSEVDFAEDDDDEEIDLIGDDPVDVFDSPESEEEETVFGTDEVRPEDVVLENADVLEDEFVDSLDGMSDEDEAFDDEAEMTYSDFDEGDELYDTMEMDDTAEDLDMFPVESRVLVTKGFVTVATLNVAKSKRDPAEVASKSFKEAFLALASKNGMRKAIRAMGFTPVKTKTVSQATVASARAKAKEEAEAKIVAAQKEIEESIALAAAGLARNQWSKINNPLRSKLTALLANVGVRDPERVATRFCQEVSEPYTTTLMSVASSLQKEGPQLRAVLARAFEVTKAEVSDTDEEDILNETTNLTSSFLTEVQPIDPIEKIVSGAERSSLTERILNGPLNLG